MSGFRILNKKMMNYFILHIVILMVGSGLIYLVTERFLIFGMKYLMMAPFLGFIACHMLTQIDYKFAVFKMSVIFGVLMIMVSFYMTIAMIIAGSLTEIVLVIYKGKKFRAFIGGTFFACFAVTSALVVSKIMVGGVFEAISWLWILLAFMISIMLGIIGASVGIILGNILNPKYKD